MPAVVVIRPDVTAGTHCTKPHSNGQAELAWVAGYMPYPQTVKRAPISALTYSSTYNIYVDVRNAIIIP